LPSHLSLPRMTRNRCCIDGKTTTSIDSRDGDLSYPQHQAPNHDLLPTDHRPSSCGILDTRQPLQHARAITSLLPPSVVIRNCNQVDDEASECRRPSPAFVTSPPSNVNAPPSSFVVVVNAAPKGKEHSVGYCTNSKTTLNS
jgi:hypothetical protein